MGVEDGLGMIDGLWGCGVWGFGLSMRDAGERGVYVYCVTVYINNASVYPRAEKSVRTGPSYYVRVSRHPSRPNPFAPFFSQL